MSKFNYTQNDGKTTTVAVFLKRHLDIRSKSGLEWQALCPFHQDTSPSFSVNIRKGLYICYACGAKGNLKQLAKHFDDNEPVATSATLDEVMDRIGELTQIVYDQSRPAVGLPYGSRYTDNEFVMDYWNGKRFLSEKQIKIYDLGFDPVDNTAIIPVKDKQKRVVGLIRRTTDPNELANGVPKYRHPKGIKMSHYLYGVAEANEKFRYHAGTDYQRSVLVICEGAVDAITCNMECAIAIKKHGRTRPLALLISGVAVFGARISGEQVAAVKSLAPDFIVIATDQDRAGRLAALQIEQELSANGASGAFICNLTWDRKYGKDMAELDTVKRRELILKATGYSDNPQMISSVDWMSGLTQ